MTNPKPRIILIHGAWHIPAHHKPLTNLLTNSGYTVHVPLLPTCNTPITSTFTDDVTTTRSLITTLCNNSQTIILLLHSYGGSVGTEASQHLSYVDRQQINQPGGIIHLIYMCAFLLQPNQSVGLTSLPRPIPDPVEAHDDGTTSICLDPRELFYHDVAPDLADAAAKMLVRHSRDAQIAGVVTYPASRHIPTTYLKCTEDKVFFPELQQRQIEAAGATEAEIEVQSYVSGHSPFLSMPGKMAEAVESVVARYA